MKVHIDCGPNLRTARVLRVRPDMGKVERVEFPEAKYGAQEIRDLIDRAAASGVGYLYIATRFSYALNYCGELIEHGVVDGVTMSLTVDEGVTFTEHHMTEEGIVSQGWPIGILW